MNKLNYEWMLLEMYDQTVRNHSGGNMGKYLFQDNIINEEFINERIGEEGRAIRKSYLTFKNKEISRKETLVSKTKSDNLFLFFKRKLKGFLLKKWDIDDSTLAIGKFRKGGEIHQWMYDRYSLAILLKDAGGNRIQKRDAFTSYLENWSNYNIDGKEGVIRKPDSLFMEAIK
jgi:hypothetical protein